MNVATHGELPLDAETPGGVYLCQVSEHVSCGACCGLYNLADNSPAHLESLLRDRSRRFASVARTAEAIDAFGRATEAREPRERPFADFHHCPFIGWIDPEPGRVGCLLHPLAAGNGGVDYRGLSYYGGLACRSYFCPSTHQLLPRYKRIVRWATTDWYLHGMIVTERRLIEAFFERIESELGTEVDLDLLAATPTARQPLADLLGLKCRWPFRPRHWNTSCHYFFTENPRPKPAPDYVRLGVNVSVYETILHELVSDFQSVEQLRDAEEIVRQRITSVVGELRRTKGTTNG